MEFFHQRARAWAKGNINRHVKWRNHHGKFATRHNYYGFPSVYQVDMGSGYCTNYRPLTEVIIEWEKSMSKNSMPELKAGMIVEYKFHQGEIIYYLMTSKTNGISSGGWHTIKGERVQAIFKSTTGALVDILRAQKRGTPIWTKTTDKEDQLNALIGKLQGQLDDAKTALETAKEA